MSLCPNEEHLPVGQKNLGPIKAPTPLAKARDK